MRGCASLGPRTKGSKYKRVGPIRSMSPLTSGFDWRAPHLEPGPVHGRDHWLGLNLARYLRFSRDSQEYIIGGLMSNFEVSERILMA